MARFVDIVDQVRTELGDTYEGSYTYSNEDMVRYAIQGVREAWRTRPSLKYDPATGLLYDEESVLPVSYDTAAASVPLPNSYVEAIVWFVVFRCASQDQPTPA